MVCGNHFAVGQKNVCGKYTNIYVTEKLSFCLFNIYCIIDVEKLVVAYAVSLSNKGCFVCCFFNNTIIIITIDSLHLSIKSVIIFIKLAK